MTQYDPRYPQPYPGHYAAPPAPQNGFGTAGFVLGLVGLLFSFVPLIGVIAWPLVLLGIVFAGVGIARARQGRATNQGLAIAGLVCSGIGLLVCILYAAAFSAAVSDAPRTAAPGTIQNAAPVEGVPAQNVVAGIGDQVQDGSFAFTVTDVDTGVQSLGESFLRTEAQGAFVLVRVTVTNVGDESAMFSGSSQKLSDGQGRTFDADTGTALMNVPDSESFLNTINPGNTVYGVLVFDLPEGLAPAAVELHESSFSDGAVVSLLP